MTSTEKACPASSSPTGEDSQVRYAALCHALFHPPFPLISIPSYLLLPNPYLPFQSLPSPFYFLSSLSPLLLPFSYSPTHFLPPIPRTSLDPVIHLSVNSNMISRSVNDGPFLLSHSLLLRLFNPSLLISS